MNKKRVPKGYVQLDYFDCYEGCEGSRLMPEVRIKRSRNWKAKEYGSFTRYEQELNRMVAIVFYDPPGVYLVYGSPIEGGAVVKADQIISIASDNAFDLADYYIEHGKFPDNPEPR